MASPRFSIVIPTRERANTLQSTLATCLAQDFDDYEIVVCDNCSSPATRQVVDNCHSDKIKYLRSNEPLAMSANWNLALSQAQGEYVTFLGDDDGLMPYALGELDSLIARHHCRAIRFASALYTWPCIKLAGEGDFLLLPLTRQLRRLDARQQIVESLRDWISYTSLPMIYRNAVVHQDLIQAARARTGRVFVNAYPDVYSAFVFGYLAGSYIDVSVPMTVEGISGHSNGIATVARLGGNGIADEFHLLNANCGYRAHSWVPDLDVQPVPVADSFLFAKEAFFPNDEFLSLDRKLLAEACVGALWTTNGEDYRQGIQRVRESLADSSELLAWFDAEAAWPARPPGRPHIRSQVLGSDGDHLRLSADQFGVRDVAGAVDLCARLLGYGKSEIRYDLPSPQETWKSLDRANQAVERLHETAKQLERRLLDFQHSWLALPYRVHRKVRRLLRRERQAG